VAYSATVEALVAAGEADAALDLFDALSGQGADAVACGAAMEAAASLGDWARCLLVFEVGWRLHGLLRTLARCVTGVRWLMFFCQYYSALYFVHY
jgi:hypothetical protein